jgi:membrane protease YdiL (CAAX protease family)
MGNDMKKYGLNLLKDTKIFNMASHSKFLPNVLLALLIFGVLWGGGMALLNLIPSSVFDLLQYVSTASQAFNRTFRRVIVCGGQILIFFTWVRFIEKRKVSTMGLYCRARLKKYMMGFLLGIITISAITLAMAALGAVQMKAESLQIQGIDLLAGVFIMLGGWIVQSASEEIAIRGWLLPVVGAKYNGLVGILATSVTFGAIHLFNPNATALSTINLVLSGIFFAMYAIFEGSIWGVSGYHCAWNWAMANIYGFSVSGFEPVGGTVISFKITGPDTITGGYFGPEGGMMLSVFLCIGIVILIMLMKRYRYGLSQRS